MRRFLLALASFALLGGTALADGFHHRRTFDWDLVTGEAEWGGRAGLQAVRLHGDLLVLGGRTPRPPQFPPVPGDSDIWGDVWRSTDGGRTWERILETNDASHWAARAYFQAVTMRGQVFVLGGQNFRLLSNPGCPDPSLGCPPFVSASDFFDDVWRSADGVNWEALTDSAGWEGRAGLMAAAFKGRLYVFGGSRNDDASIIGGPPQRIYYNDVWRSTDGASWERVTQHAPWSPRAGSAVTVKDGWLYLLGGEAGFLCAPQPCQLPYFNDVWRTRDGAHWELVTASAGWSPRPGHQCVTFHDRIVCFGGFGTPVNPIDMWASRDGARWKLLRDKPWDAVSPDEGKYDFDALVVPGRRGPAIMTFGGDRETFDFTDPTNYLRVDDEVWRYAPARECDDFIAGNMTESFEGEDAPSSESTSAEVPPGLSLAPLGTNRTAGRVMLGYSLPEAARVKLVIYDVRGRLVRTLVDGTALAGSGQIEWDARDATGRRVSPGVYFGKIAVAGAERTARIVLLR